jgi:hypothetical protein
MRWKTGCKVTEMHDELFIGPNIDTIQTSQRQCCPTHALISGRAGAKVGVRISLRDLKVSSIFPPCTAFIKELLQRAKNFAIAK